MTARAARNHWVARIIVSATLVIAIVACGLGVQQARQASATNRQAIVELQSARTVRSLLTSTIELKLCVDLRKDRERWRTTIIEGPASLREAFVAAGVSKARTDKIYRLRTARKRKLLMRYPPISCETLRRLVAARASVE